MQKDLRKNKVKRAKKKEAEKSQEARNGRKGGCRNRAARGNWIYIEIAPDVWDIYPASDADSWMQCFQAVNEGTRWEWVVMAEDG